MHRPNPTCPTSFTTTACTHGRGNGWWIRMRMDIANSSCRLEPADRRAHPPASGPPGACRCTLDRHWVGRTVSAPPNSNLLLAGGDDELRRDALAVVLV